MRFLDFSKKLSFKEKIKNVFIALGLSWVAMGVATLIMTILKVNIPSLVTPKPLPESIDAIFLYLAALFFVVITPLWEEAVFRLIPLKIVQRVTKNRIALIVVVLTSSILFGWIHGSVYNIFLQGIFGLMLCWLFLKNNNSYFSCVVAHGIHNGIAVLLPLLFYFYLRPL